MENALRGKVLSKFPSITAFAVAMKWDRKKASRIVNHVQHPTVRDIEEMTDVLDVTDADTLVAIFLPSISTKWN